MVCADITWFRQGYWDGLCGFYASLNAMWALFPELRGEKTEKRYRSTFKDSGRQRQVFDEAVDLLSRVGGTTVRTLQSHPDMGGIDPFQIEDLVLKMGLFWGYPITIKLLHEMPDRKPSFNRFLLDERKIGRFAMIGGTENGDHWGTVYEAAAGKFSIVDPSGEGEVPVGGRGGLAIDHHSGVLIRRAD